MQTAKGKVVEGGRIILPAAFRRSLGLEKGDTVLIELHDDELRVRPARAALRRLQAKLRGLGPADARASDALVAERRAEAAREADRESQDRPGPPAGAEDAPDAPAEPTAVEPEADGEADHG